MNDKPKHGMGFDTAKPKAVAPGMNFQGSKQPKAPPPTTSQGKPPSPKGR